MCRRYCEIPRICRYLHICICSNFLIHTLINVEERETDVFPVGTVIQKDSAIQARTIVSSDAEPHCAPVLSFVFLSHRPAESASIFREFAVTISFEHYIVLLRHHKPH